MPIQSKNPVTLEVFKIFSEVSDEELETKLVQADQAFQLWRNISFAERAQLMKKMSAYLNSQQDHLSNLMTLEMGKLKGAGMAEVQKCALTCDYYAEHAEEFLANEVIATDAEKSYVRFDPLGLVLAVMPWNFPFWQVYRFAVPALMAGNVGLLKHASNVPQCAEAIEAAFLACDFPMGVFQNIILSSGRVEKVIRDPRIKAVTLTGSERAGSEVAKVAAEEIKKTVLELGGSDPFIVLSDADVSLSCQTAVLARLQNNTGQSCIAAKRFIVHEAVAEAFIEGLARLFGALKVGDPALPDSQVGPLATEQVLRDTERQVQESVAGGAKLIVGGKRLNMPGYFYEPTILSQVTSSMPVYNEEVFGPVAAVIIAASDEEAVRIANDNRYGLGASLFTRDTARAEQLAQIIESGAVFINGQVKSDPRLPFGGIKKSGYGRELSHYGIREFVNIKTVWVK